MKLFLGAVGSSHHPAASSRLAILGRPPGAGQELPAGPELKWGLHSWTCGHMPARSHPLPLRPPAKPQEGLGGPYLRNTGGGGGEDISFRSWVCLRQCLVVWRRHRTLEPHAKASLCPEPWPGLFHLTLPCQGHLWGCGAQVLTTTKECSSGDS